jgi:hypothetical protein
VPEEGSGIGPESGSNTLSNPPPKIQDGKGENREKKGALGKPLTIPGELRI